MGRPRKCRWVEVEPWVTFFKPQGIPLRGLEHTVITVDELEALRLADYLELTQEEVAQKMQVSRPTVTRMLARARKVVADALVHGKAIRIQGGITIWVAKESAVPLAVIGNLSWKGRPHPRFAPVVKTPGTTRKRCKTLLNR